MEWNIWGNDWENVLNLDKFISRSNDAGKHLYNTTLSQFKRITWKYFWLSSRYRVFFVRFVDISWRKNKIKIRRTRTVLIHRFGRKPFEVSFNYFLQMRWLLPFENILKYLNISVGVDAVFFPQRIIFVTLNLNTGFSVEISPLVLLMNEKSTLRHHSFYTRRKTHPFLHISTDETTSV